MRRRRAPLADRQDSLIEPFVADMRRRLGEAAGERNAGATVLDNAALELEAQGL